MDSKQRRLAIRDAVRYAWLIADIASAPEGMHRAQVAGRIAGSGLGASGPEVDRIIHRLTAMGIIKVSPSRRVTATAEGETYAEAHREMRARERAARARKAAQRMSRGIPAASDCTVTARDGAQTVMSARGSAVAPGATWADPTMRSTRAGGFVAK